MVRFQFTGGVYDVHEDVLKLHASDFHKNLGHNGGPSEDTGEGEPSGCSKCPHPLPFRSPVFHDFTKWLLNRKLPTHPQEVIELAMLGNKLKVYELEDNAMTFLFLYYKAQRKVPELWASNLVFDTTRGEYTVLLRQFYLDIYYAFAKPSDLDALDRSSMFPLRTSILRGMGGRKAKSNEEVQEQGHANPFIMRMCD
jgi:hypothetical protein